MTTTERGSDIGSAGAYADVNGVRFYYETHGTGRALLLLHGGLGSGEMFAAILPTLTDGHQATVVDLQGHGRTADVDRPIEARLMADDIAALIDHLGLDRPDVFGYSLGGGVAFWLARTYPERVGRLIMVSAHTRRDAIYADMLAQQGQVGSASVELLKDTPMYQLYQRVAPRPEDFGRLLDKIGESMAKDFDLADEVRQLQVPTMIACADADMAPPRHYVEQFELLGGGQRDGGWMGEGRPEGGHALAIIPNATHYDVIYSPVLAVAAKTFLDAPRG
jgi:pimeloyl-ACP methyl ester carboxylesterase